MSSYTPLEMRAMVAPFFDQDPENLPHVTIIAVTQDREVVYADMDFKVHPQGAGGPLICVIGWLTFYLGTLVSLEADRQRQGWPTPDGPSPDA